MYCLHLNNFHELHVTSCNKPQQRVCYRSHDGSCFKKILSISELWTFFPHHTLIGCTTVFFLLCSFFSNEILCLIHIYIAVHQLMSLDIYGQVLKFEKTLGTKWRRQRNVLKWFIFHFWKLVFTNSVCVVRSEWVRESQRNFWQTFRWKMTFLPLDSHSSIFLYLLYLAFLFSLPLLLSCGRSHGWAGSLCFGSLTFPFSSLPPSLLSLPVVLHLSRAAQITCMCAHADSQDGTTGRWERGWYPQQPSARFTACRSD